MALTTASLAEYLSNQTRLFTADQPLQITELSRADDKYIDGYLNYLYAVKQGGRSYIVKHAQQTSSSGIGDWLLDPFRNYLEFMTYQLRYGLTQEMVPQVFLADSEKHLFVMEDLSDMKIMRFALCQGRQPYFLGQAVGKFLAQCHYYTSQFHVEPQQFEEMGQFFANPEMRSMVVDFILQPPLTAAPEADDYQQALQKIMGQIYHDPLIKQEWQQLTANFSNRQQCLIHGDFHTSNVFIDDEKIRVIDMEYSMLAPFAYDLGYFLANLLSQYAAFHVKPAYEQNAQSTMQQYLLHMIQEVFTSYFETFQDCFQQRHGGQNLQPLFLEIFQDAIGYLAMANLTRTANPGEFPDFDCISQRSNWFCGKALTMKISQQLLRRRKEITSPAELVTCIQQTEAVFVTA